MSRLTSCKGLLALLMETDSSILGFALKRLNEVVDEFWYEISSHLQLTEELCESQDLPELTRQHAALLTSRVYFHLGEYNDSIQFALSAGKLFTPTERTPYADTILAKCIDLYVADRESPNPEKPIDPRLEKLFCSLADSWSAKDDGFASIKELIGFTVRARRLDMLEALLKKHVETTGSSDMLTFTLNTVNIYVTDIAFRRSILEILVKLYKENVNSIDYFALIQCLLFLGDAPSVAALVKDLLAKDRQLIAYQIAFDLFDHGTQEFVQSVTDNLQKLCVTPESAAPKPLDPNLDRITSGELTTQLYVKFLYSQCRADIHILNGIKKSIDTRNSITHSATVIANSLMYCGTTIDGFLRDNLEWLSKSANWAKFTATATIGVIHRGHAEEAMNVLKPYLPTGTVAPLPYQEAGAYFALGLIYAPTGASRNKETVTLLREALRTYAANEQLVHGASLGLGIAAMGLHNEEIFDALFACVSGCDAVAGEGAAAAIGLVMMGSGKQQSADMLLRHARELDQKEKTIRGLSMAIALIMMGQEADADPLIEQMLGDTDPWLRVGGCFTLGLAYAGTSNTKAIERLLQVAVRDVSDEVRRNAVMQIGFLTYKDPQICVEMTRILADSYSAHIRYGVAMAIGVAAAGTGNAAALDLLWLLKDDAIDFVRQGAYIALSMVVVQLTEAQCPRVKEFRTLLSAKIADRKEDTCTRFGCIIASGIIDCGGRNCTLALHRQRHSAHKSIVGVFFFTQYWYWFPYTLMLSLAMQPTCVIALNKDLEMPKYVFKSNAPASRFTVPKTVLHEKKESKEKGVKQAVLSTTVKESEFQKKRRQTQGGSGTLEGEDSAKGPAETAKVSESGGGGGGGGGGAIPAAEAAGGPKEPKEEPFEILTNPARVTMTQLEVVSHNVDPRYYPLKANPMGVCLLVDRTPEAAKELIANINPNDRDDDVKPPEAFEWP